MELSARTRGGRSVSPRVIDDAPPTDGLKAMFTFRPYPGDNPREGADVNNHLNETVELWKRWRAADTQLHRIAAMAQRDRTSAMPSDEARRCQAHAHASRKRAAILKRLFPISAVTRF